MNILPYHNWFVNLLGSHDMDEAMNEEKMKEGNLATDLRTHVHSLLSEHALPDILEIRIHGVFVVQGKLRGGYAKSGNPKARKYAFVHAFVAEES